ncbi:PIG-L family deacetylase [Candidatus Woesearchaeota archaeon]|nr:PIG-L family deacetylase [Candidatus Woesearchaeota archaeon]
MKIIFSPHPDDAFLSLGGAIHEWVKSGEKVKVVDFFTVSNYTNRGILDTEEVTKTRKLEEEKAAQFENVEVEFLDFKDSFLRGYDDFPYPKDIRWDIDTETLQKIKEEIIKRAEENECYFPLAIGSHVGHLLVRTAAHDLIKEGKIKHYFFYEDLFYAAEYPFESGFAKEMGLVPHLIKIDISEKEKVLHVYKSQRDSQWELIKPYSYSLGDEGFYERVWG